MKKIFFLIVFIFGCSAEPEKYNQCTLSCGNAVLGATDFKVRAVIPKISVPCKASAKGGFYDETPMTLKFYIGNDYATTTKSATTAGTSTTETPTSNGVKPKMPDFTPISNLAFNPLIVGLLGITGSNTENGVISGDSFTPVEYRGIVTPKSEWCTDSCGYATLVVTPRCVSDSSNETIVSIISGGTKPLDLTTDAVTITAVGKLITSTPTSNGSSTSSTSNTNNAEEKK